MVVSTLSPRSEDICKTRAHLKYNTAQNTLVAKTKAKAARPSGCLSEPNCAEE
jgi:hypothetical protein